MQDGETHTEGKDIFNDSTKPFLQINEMHDGNTQHYMIPKNSIPYQPPKITRIKPQQPQQQHLLQYHMQQPQQPKITRMKYQQPQCRRQQMQQMQPQMQNLFTSPYKKKTRYIQRQPTQYIQSIYPHQHIQMPMQQ